MLEISGAVQSCTVDDLVCLGTLIFNPDNGTVPFPEIELFIIERYTALRDKLLPKPNGYEYVSLNNHTFTFRIEIGGQLQTLTGKKTFENGDTYIWIPSVTFGAFTSTPTEPEIFETRLRQSQYSYLGLLLAWDIYQPNIPLDLKMLLAIYYRGELGLTSDNIRLEALARSFFDPNAACGNQLTCDSFYDISEFLTASSFWFNRTQTVNNVGDVTKFGEFARVRIDGSSGATRGLLVEAHITSLVQDAANNVGPFAVDNHISSIFDEHLNWLKAPGQSLSLPSRWGNFVQDSTLEQQLVNKTGDQIRATVEAYLRANSSMASITVFEVSFEDFGNCISVFVVTNSVGVSGLGTCGS